VQSEQLTGLGAFGNFDMFFSLKGRNRDFFTQCGLYKGYLRPIDDIRIAALKLFVRFYGNE
jgi:hypothetical protein